MNTKFINSKWVEARPVNYRYRTFRQRLRQAWDVFIGNADARYYEGQ